MAALKTIIRIATTLGLLILIWLTPLASQAQSLDPTASINEPGLRLHVKGARHYLGGNDRMALHYFTESARWGNKVSQFMLGSMYLNGRAGKPDRPRAWAWIELAAERGYRQMISAGEQIWREMSEAEREAAQRIHRDELLPEFGDADALPRTERHMRQRHRQATGSRLPGTGSSPVIIQDFDGWSTRSGDTYYDSRDWSIDLIIQREREWFNGLSSPRAVVRDLPDEPETSTPPD